MKQENSFLNKIQPLSDYGRLTDNEIRFKERNDKTIGFMVYSAHEQDVMRARLEGRVGLKISKRPDTKLYR